MRLLRLSLLSLFLWLKGWHAPAGRRSVNPGLLPRPGRSDRQRRWVPKTNRDPAGGPVSGQPSYGVKPGNRPDQIPAPTLRPYPPKTTEAGPKHSPTSSLPITGRTAASRDRDTQAYIS